MVGKFQRRFLNPADNTGWRSRCNSRFMHDSSRFARRAIGLWMWRKDNCVARQQANERLKNHRAGRVRDRNNPSDNPYWVGNLKRISSTILRDNSTGFSVLVLVIHHFRSKVVFDNLIFYYALPCFLTSKFR